MDELARFEGWNEHLFDPDKELFSVLGPSSSIGSMKPFNVRALTKVIVFQ